jgi:hypothetical protein
MRNILFKHKASHCHYDVADRGLETREGEKKKVPLAGIDSRFVSFAEHAVVRAPLSRLNLLKRSSGHPRSPVMALYSIE